MFAYCCNNPIMYSDSLGLKRVSAFRAEMGGGKTQSSTQPIPDVGDGNYYDFDREDLYSQHKTEYPNISREEANMFYDEIKAGDFGKMINIPIASGFLGLFDDNISASLELLFDLLDSANSLSSSQTYDPEGRLLYLEAGYSVVVIERIYTGNGYGATENEYFIFDKEMGLVFNDTIKATRYSD